MLASLPVYPLPPRRSPPVHRPHTPAARPPRPPATAPPDPIQEFRPGRHIDPATWRLLVRYGELVVGLLDELEAERAAAAVGGGGPEVKVATSSTWGAGVAGKLDLGGHIADQRARKLEAQLKAARERLRRTVHQLEEARGLRPPTKGRRDARGRLAILVSNPAN